MQLVFSEIRVSHEFQTHVVQTLEGAHTGGADGNSLTVVVEEFGDGLSSHADVFSMHLMPLHLLALDWLERTSTHMEGEFLALYTMSIEIGQYLWREVQTCRWGCHTTFNFRVDGLVGRLIAILCLTIQIGRNGQLTHDIKNLGK